MTTLDPTRAAWGESERIASLRSYAILDTPREIFFDDAVKLAAQICATPYAALCLIDTNRLWFKAEIGLDAMEGPKAAAMCVAASRQRHVFCISDCKTHSDFADNSVVRAAPFVRFYAAAPLISADGFPLGTLCVLDPTPRADGITSAQAEALQALARQVMTHLDLRRSNAAQDMAEQRLAATVKQLHKSEGQFRMLADILPQIAWSATADGRNDYFNRRWYDYTGAPPDSTEAQSFMHPDDIGRIAEAWAHSGAADDVYESEYRLRRHDGEYRWMLVRAQPIRGAGGEIERWFGTSTDIHDIKLAEMANAKLAAIVASSADAIISYSPEGKIRIWNQGAERLYGYTAAEAVGKDISLLASEEERTAQRGIVKRILAGEMLKGESIRQRKDGESFVLAWTATPLSDKSGRIIGFTSVSSDVTERRRGEHARELMTRELDHRIKNIFSVVASLITLSTRRDPALARFGEDMRERLVALSTAQGYVRTRGDTTSAAADQTLRGLLTELLRPYRADDSARFTLSGDDLAVGLQAATALSMIIHEQATNALKYGALSRPEGSVAITLVRDGDTVILSWHERGGPPVTQPPLRQGFGSEMITGNVERQLGGSLVHEWRPEGLLTQIRIPAANLET